ncbi:MAG TPA: hypothetical protein VMT58_09600 [Candidatus Binataceae bacterium]|nr:hypothetical protein [Candidatus Binataceae bacterium]
MAMGTLAVAAFFFAMPGAWADSLSDITTPGAQGANDSVDWSQLGADGTALETSFNASSSMAISVSGSFAGSTATSLIANVCPNSPCSWANGTGGSTPFAADDALIWTADAGSSGNGPVTLTLSSSVSGAGALIQEDAPGQFTAKVEVFNGSSSLGTFSESSDSSGHPIYIGVKDTSGEDINKIIFSMTSSGGDNADFALDALQLNNSPVPAGPLQVTPASGSFGTVKLGKSKVKTFHLKNPANKGGSSIKITGWDVSDGPEFSTFAAKTTCTVGTVLVPKKQCIVAVQFTPAGSGSRPPSGGPATLTIQNNANNAPQVVQFSGAGK